MRATLLISCVLASAFALVACEDSLSEAGSLGSVSIPLLATADAGTEYRLADARFRIEGDGRRTVSARTGDAFHFEDLSPGTYTVELLNGWTLERYEGSRWRTTQDAVLMSANPMTMTVVEGRTTDMTFRFGAGAELIPFGQGQARVGIEVVEPGDFAIYEFSGVIDTIDDTYGLPFTDFAFIGQTVTGTFRIPLRIEATRTVDATASYHPEFDDIDFELRVRGLAFGLTGLSDADVSTVFSVGDAMPGAGSDSFFLSINARGGAPLSPLDGASVFVSLSDQDGTAFTGVTPPAALPAAVRLSNATFGFLVDSVDLTLSYGVAGTITQIERVQ